MASESREITTGGAERIPPTTELYKDAFRDDPVFRYMLSNLSEEERYAWLPDFFKGVFTAAGLNAGLFDEIANWSACSVLMPPKAKVANPLTLPSAGIFGFILKLGFGGVWRLLVQFVGTMDKVKKKGMPEAAKTGEFWYVFFVATKEECRGSGLASDLVRKVQERAALEKEGKGVPVWLEATTEKSWKIYEKLGFETVECVRFGKGMVDKEGFEKRDGEVSGSASFV
jgi:ribosomal protein S18 acetylase RimI-like enzyme